LPKALQIASVEISLFAHATESEEKVLLAARSLLPPTKLENITFSRSNLRGHHGNPILLFETKITDKDVIGPVVENLATNLSALDKENLLNEIGKHLEKGSLFVRLDKQAAFAGSFRMTTADPIRIRLRFKKNRLEDIVQICREIGLLP